MIVIKICQIAVFRVSCRIHHCAPCSFHYLLVTAVFDIVFKLEKSRDHLICHHLNRKIDFCEIWKLHSWTPLESRAGLLLFLIVAGRRITVIIEFIRNPFIFNFDLTLHISWLVFNHYIFLSILVLHLCYSLFSLFTFFNIAITHLLFWYYWLFLNFLCRLARLPWYCWFIIDLLFCFIYVKRTFATNNWLFLRLKTLYLAFELVVFLLVFLYHNAIILIFLLELLSLSLNLLPQSLNLLLLFLKVLITWTWFQLSLHDSTLIFDFIELISFVFFEFFLLSL